VEFYWAGEDLTVPVPTPCVCVPRVCRWRERGGYVGRAYASHACHRQGSLFSTSDSTFSTWTRKDAADGTNVMAPLGGGHENSGQWMMPVPNTVDGESPPSGDGNPNMVINTAGGQRYVFATWDSVKETLTPWTAPPGAPSTGQVANLERSRASWWGASGGTDNNGRMMMIGWATPDFHGDAGKGINFLTRLTGLREVHRHSHVL
jgi:hypothetical protein